MSKNVKCGAKISETHDYNHFISITALSSRWVIGAKREDGEWEYYGDAREDRGKELRSMIEKNVVSSVHEPMPGGWFIMWVRKMPR